MTKEFFEKYLEYDGRRLVWLVDRPCLPKGSFAGAMSTSKSYRRKDGVTKVHRVYRVGINNKHYNVADIIWTLLYGNVPLGKRVRTLSKTRIIRPQDLFLMDKGRYLNDELYAEVKVNNKIL